MVRQAEDPHRGLYDTDLLEHVIVLSDWGHESIASMYAAQYHSTDDASIRSILVNGKGRNTAAQVLGYRLGLLGALPDSITENNASTDNIGGRGMF